MPLSRPIDKTDNESIAFEVTNPGGARRNITNDTLVFTATKLHSNGTPLLTKSGAQVNKTNPAQGECRVDFVPADWAALATRSTEMRYALRLTDPDDKVYTVADDTFQVKG